MSRRLCQLFALLVVWGSTPNVSRAAEPLELRWVYLQQNLQVAENLPKIEAMLRRAAKSGYNGVVLADYKLNVLDRVPEHYFKNAARFREICRELKLEIIPTVAGFGYSSGILAHDPNLAEGLPARDVPFVVKAGKVVLDVDGKSLIPGDFENLKGDTFSGWGFQDEPGQGTFADTTVKHGGKTSLRIQNAAGVEGNRRVSKPIKVRRGHSSTPPSGSKQKTLNRRVRRGCSRCPRRVESSRTVISASNEIRIGRSTTLSSTASTAPRFGSISARGAVAAASSGWTTRR